MGAPDVEGLPWPKGEPAPLHDAASTMSSAAAQLGSLAGRITSSGGGVLWTGLAFSACDFALQSQAQSTQGSAAVMSESSHAHHPIAKFLGIPAATDEAADGGARDSAESNLRIGPDRYSLTPEQLREASREADAIPSAGYTPAALHDRAIHDQVERELQYARDHGGELPPGTRIGESGSSPQAPTPSRIRMASHRTTVPHPTVTARTRRS